MAGLLDGMRVLDLSVWRPMPQATQMLADLGAEVLKVEPPGGDPMRGYPEIFATVGRGKRSIVLDLKTDAGRDRAQDLAAEADVVCEGWRPGVAARFGLDHASVAARNPAVVYCSLSGYGQEGPLRAVPGHDLNFQALAGALRTRPGVDPAVPALPVADLGAGSVAAFLVVAAWARRLRTGEGERIDVAMTDAVSWWVGTGSGTAHADADVGERADGSPGYGVFRTRDGGWLALGVLAEQRLWVAICDALDLPDLAPLDFGARLARTTEINDELALAVASRDHDDAYAALEAGGAPVSRVLRPEEVASDPQILARGFHVHTDAGVVAALPAVLASDGRVAPSAIPAVGEHPEGFRS